MVQDKITKDSPKYITNTEKIQFIQNIHFAQKQILQDNGRSN